MTLPSKKLGLITVACVALLIGTIFLRQHQALLDSQKNIEGKATTTPVALKSRDFYEQAIPVSATSSITDSMSRDFFLNFADLQNKKAWNVDSQAALIENISSAYATTSKPTYKLANIVVFPDTDRARVKIFGNAVAEVLASYRKNLTENPFAILNDAISTDVGSTTFQKRLKLISTNYSLLAKDLSKIPAPATLAPTYLDVVNTYSYISADVVNMQSYFSDPVRGLLGMTMYQKNVVNLADLLKNIALYFKANGILFTTTERGSVWTSLTQ